MTKMRWWLGGALSVLAMVACVQALATYVAHHLWLGAATVLVLAVMNVAGFISLARTRRWLHQQVVTLVQDPPHGTWVAERRTRLERIHAAGGQPDVETLSNTDAAELRSQAYVGRYVVAVTVLVGLVGTFAGLMETLRTVAPLLRQDGANTLALLAGPLSGLDVTFGASVVAILVTLALSLVQGDLELAEQEALAKVDDVTRHILVPSVWPPAEQPNARAALEMVALRADLAGWAQKTREQTAQDVAAATRVQLESLAVNVEQLVRTTVGAASQQLTEQAAGTARAIQEALAPSLTAQLEALAALGQKTAQHMADATAQVSGAGTQLSGALRDAASTAATGMLQAGAQHLERLEALNAQHTQGWTRVMDALASGANARAQLDQNEAQERTQAVAAMQQVASQSAAVMEKHLTDAVTQMAQAWSQGAATQQKTAQAWEEQLAASVRRSTEALTALTATAAQAGAQLEQGMHSLAGQLATSTQAQVDALAQASGALKDVQGAQAQQLASSTQAQADALAQGAQGLQDAQHAVVQQLAAHAQTQLDALSQAADRLQAMQSTMAAQMGQDSQALQSALQDVASQQARVLEDAALRVEQALSHNVLETARALDGVLGRMGEAAERLEGSAQALQPAVNTLVPELGSLAREVALLATQRGDDDTDGTMLAEINRLGDGMDRLTALVNTARNGQGAQS